MKIHGKNNFLKFLQAPIFKRLTTPEPKPIKTLQQFTAVPSKKTSSPPPTPKKSFPIWDSASVKPFRIAETPFREEIIHQTNSPIHQLNSPNHHLNSEDETRKLRKQKSSVNLAIIPAENKPYNHPNTPVPYSTLLVFKWKLCSVQNSFSKLELLKTNFFSTLYCSWVDPKFK